MRVKADVSDFAMDGVLLMKYNIKAESGEL